MLCLLTHAKSHANNFNLQFFEGRWRTSPPTCIPTSKAGLFYYLFFILIIFQFCDIEIWQDIPWGCGNTWANGTGHTSILLFVSSQSKEFFFITCLWVMFEPSPLGVTFLQIIKLPLNLNIVMAYIGFNGKVAPTQNFFNLQINHLKVDFWFHESFWRLHLSYHNSWMKWPNATNFEPLHMFCELKVFFRTNETIMLNPPLQHLSIYWSTSTHSHKFGMQYGKD